MNTKETETPPTAVNREPCPYCGLDALTGPNAHADRNGCIDAMRMMHLNYRRRVGIFVLDHLEEVLNHHGAVIGYRLQLSADETEKLIRVIESA